MIEWNEKKPEKTSIYYGLFPSGNFRYFIFDSKVKTVGRGKIGFNYTPLVSPIKWRKITKYDFCEITYRWNLEKKYFEEDFSD